MLTVNGRIKLRRIRWSLSGQGSQVLTDRYLDQCEQTISVGVRELACRLNGSSSNFERTASNLARAAQVQASGETVRKLIESEGNRVVQAVERGLLPCPWSALDCHTPVSEQPASATIEHESLVAEQSMPVVVDAHAAPHAAISDKTRIYFGCDGVMVPMITAAEKQKRRQAVKQKRLIARKQNPAIKPAPLARGKPGTDHAYKEVKLVTYYDQTQTHRVVFATTGNHQQAGRLMKQLAKLIKLEEADERIGNVDGAPWIRHQVERHSLNLTALGLDFYHLAEHVHAARRAVFGEQPQAGHDWAGQLLHTFKHVDYDQAWESLTAWQQSLRGQKRHAAKALLHYVSQRRDMIDYPEFQRRGWQIGSGPTEAQCKTLTARVKGSGKRWDPDNAQAIIAIEALVQSNLWGQYWQTQYQLTT